MRRLSSGLKLNFVQSKLGKKGQTPKINSSPVLGVGLLIVTKFPVFTEDFLADTNFGLSGVKKKLYCSVLLFAFPMLS